MKKMIKKYRKAKGFTLVELLIVIIIIGILAGMMMLSTGSATDRAEATKIVSDLRNLKSAALLAYLDNSNTWVTDLASLDKYVDQKIDSDTEAKYDLGSVNSDDIYVSYKGTMSTGVKDKLSNMAKDAGLYENNLETPYTNGTEVFMIVRKSSDD